MGGDIGSPRIEIRLGRDLVDAADEALECEGDSFGKFATSCRRSWRWP
jgi:hypothetical protein